MEIRPAMIERLAGPSGVLGGCWFVIDHLVPDLLPTLPQAIAWALAGLALAFAAMIWTLRGWRALNRRAPRPWWPRPFWRIGDWLQQRPGLHILTAVGNVQAGLERVEAMGFILTVQRNLTRTRRPPRLDFETARLEVIQTRGGRERRWRLGAKPDAFLQEVVEAGLNDHVRLVFVATGYPLPHTEALDFARPYRLRLSGVEAQIWARGPIRGRLAVVVWTSPPTILGAPITF